MPIWEPTPTEYAAYLAEKAQMDASKKIEAITRQRNAWAFAFLFSAIAAATGWGILIAVA